MAAATIMPEVGLVHETTAKPVHVIERLVVDAGGRWDAIALLQSLWDKHAYLVQDDSEHWISISSSTGCAPLLCFGVQMGAATLFARPNDGQH